MSNAVSSYLIDYIYHDIFAHLCCIYMHYISGIDTVCLSLGVRSQFDTVVGPLVNTDKCNHWKYLGANTEHLERLTHRMRLFQPLYSHRRKQYLILLIGTFFVAHLSVSKHDCSLCWHLNLNWKKCMILQ